MVRQKSTCHCGKKFSTSLLCKCVVRCDRLSVDWPAVLPNRLTGRAYVDFLQNELPLLLEEVPLVKRMCMVFQHDGAPAHYSRLVTHHLNLTFPEQWIGRGGHVQWPPTSPDLTPLDFCLWGWMKSEVYKEEVNTRDELVVSHYE